MAMLIFLVRIFIRKKVSPAIIYYMWMLLIIKLILPLGPKSAVSIYNVLNFDYKAIVSQNLNNKNNNISVQPSEINMASTQVTNVDNKNLSVKKVHFDNKVSAINKLNYKEVLFFVWITGVALLAAYTVICIMRFKTIICNNVIEREADLNRTLEYCNSIIKNSNKAEVILVDEINSPSLYGIFNPKILIPSSMLEELTDNELKHIILHELCHYKRKDLILSWTIHLMKIIYWFNPIILWGLNTMKSDCEISCDAMVLSHLDKGENVAYGNTIVNVLNCVKRSNYLPGTTSIIINKNNLKERIEMIANNKKFNVKRLILGISIVVCVGLVGLTGRNIKSNAISVNAKDESKATVIKIAELSAEEISKSNNEQIIPYSGISKSYSVDNAISDGNIVMLSTSSTENNVYNISRLDEFINNINSGKKDKIRIIKYALQGNKTLINKLEDVEFDGQKLMHVGYNTYAKTGDTSKPIPVVFAKIGRSSSNNGIRYSICESKDTPDNMGANLISFFKSNIKN